jgi:DNA invertase Pin-like site-specific DNA recombinase
LLELCAITKTLVFDGDGCYDPSDFNDSLVLGMKGSFAQAELHIIRPRLHGGKLNRAQKGALRFPCLSDWFSMATTSFSIPTRKCKKRQASLNKARMKIKKSIGLSGAAGGCPS